MTLSPAETAFVDNLIDLGDPSAAAAAAGVQPSLGHDPRIQSALVDRLRGRGALDAAHARAIILRIAEKGENDTVRFRAASLLWERGLGKVPDEVNVNVTLEHVDRASLHAEIKQLITELGMPPLIEGDFEEVVEVPAELPADPPVEAASPAKRGTRQEPPSSDPSPYVPDLPQKWQ